MNKYDDIVVGSGISGLTMALLLAMSGHKVLLLEKAPQIGGSLARFSRQSIPFDTGFHFTGGLDEGGILNDMLAFLGMRDAIEPVFIADELKNSFIFEAAGRSFEHPVGIDNIKAKFCSYFPAEKSAIDRYFQMVESVCSRTPSLKIHDNLIAPPNLEEDYLSLDEVLQGLTTDPLLRGLLSGYAMCYGVRPMEISFANHARMVRYFYQSIAFVKNGGDAFISGFKQRLAAFDVDVRCSSWIAELADIRDSKVGRFVLNSGEEIVADSCVFTIHPSQILQLLPAKSFSKAFGDRVNSFESSAGFFSVYAGLKPGCVDPYPEAAIVSMFPTSDVNELLDPVYKGLPALVLIKSVDSSLSAAGKSVCLLEPSFVSDVASWSASSRGSRPEGYLAYKQQRSEAIKEHLLALFPRYRDCLDFFDAGSMLTMKDYCNSFDGSAYGVKQKMRQFNLIGKLPLHNLFAAGQSALLPGIIGAMMSSLIVGRAVVGKEQYGSLLEKSTCS